MMTAKDFAEALGRQEIADAVGVGLTAVSNAVVRGEFPSSWYLAVKSVADRQGRQCPPDLFKMRSVYTRNVDQPPARQGKPLKNKAGTA